MSWRKDARRRLSALAQEDAQVQACLPGKLAGPDVKNTTEQKAKLLSEYVDSDDWNVSIALPADAVAALYKVPSCGLPSELDPNAFPTSSAAMKRWRTTRPDPA